MIIVIRNFTAATICFSSRQETSLKYYCHSNNNNNNNNNNNKNKTNLTLKTDNY